MNSAHFSCCSFKSYYLCQHHEWEEKRNFARQLSERFTDYLIKLSPVVVPLAELQSSHRSIPGWSCSLAVDITSLCLGWQYFSRSLDASLCSPTVWLSRALTSAPQVAGRVTFFSQCLSTSRRQVESFPCFSMLSRVPTGTRSFSPTSYHLERHSWISSLTSTRSSNVSTSEGKMKGGHRHWRIFNLSWLLFVMKSYNTVCSACTGCKWKASVYSYVGGLYQFLTTQF